MAGESQNLLIKVSVDLSQPVQSAQQLADRLRAIYQNAFQSIQSQAASGAITPQQAAQSVGVLSNLGYSAVSSAQQAGIVSKDQGPSLRGVITSEIAQGTKLVKSTFQDMGVSVNEFAKDVSAAKKILREGGSAAGVLYGPDGRLLPSSSTSASRGIDQDTLDKAHESLVTRESLATNESLQAQRDRTLAAEARSRVGLVESNLARAEAQANVSAQTASAEAVQAAQQNAKAEYLKAKAKSEEALLNNADVQLAKESAAISHGSSAARIKAAKAKDETYQADVIAAEKAQIEADAAKRVATSQERLAARKLVAAAEIEQANILNSKSDASVFQRFYAGTRNASAGVKSGSTQPLLAEEAPTLGGFLQSRLFTTGSYLASGALLFKGAESIKDALEGSEELEKTLNVINSELEQMGQGANAQRFVEQIKDISRETGQATNDVAKIGFQFAGAFQDINKALGETRAASELSRITELPLTEITDSLTAMAVSFDEVGFSIRDIGDVAVGLQEKFGVLAKETIEFTADLAPTAAAAGFTAKQIEVIGAVIQKYSGRSGSSSAEQFARILPAIQEQSVKLIQYLQSSGNVPDDLIDNLVGQFQTGNVAGVLDTIGRAYGSLNESQKKYIETLLGSRREAQTIIPILRHYDEVVSASADSVLYAGKQEEYFSNIQHTLSQSIERAKVAFQLFAIDLVESGLTDFLKDILNVSSSLITIIGRLLETFKNFSESLGGIPTKIIEIVLAVQGLRLALRGLGADKLLGTLFGVASETGAGGEIVAANTIGSRLGRGITGARNRVLGPSVAELSAQRYALQGGGAAISAGSTGLLSAEEAALVGGTAAPAAFGSKALAALGGPAGIIAIGTYVAAQFLEHFTSGYKKHVEESVASLANEAGDFTGEQVRQALLEKAGNPSLLRQLSGGLDSSLKHVGISAFGDLAASTGEGAQGALNQNYGVEYAQLVREIAQKFGIGIEGSKHYPGSVLSPVQYNQEELLSQIESGKTDLKSLQKYIDQISETNPALAEFVKTFFANYDIANQKIAHGNSSLESVTNSVGATKAAYESGQVGLADYITSLEAEIALLETLKPSLTEDQVQQLAQDKAEISNQITSAVHAQVAYEKQLRDATGRGSAALDTADLLGQLELEKDIPGLDPDELASTRLLIIQAIKAQADEDVKNAVTAEEKAALRVKGISIEEEAPGLRLEVLKDEILKRNIAFQLFLKKNVDAASVIDPQTVDQIANLMNDLSISFAEAFKLTITNRINQMKALLVGANRGLQANINEEVLRLRNAVAEVGTESFGLDFIPEEYHPTGPEEVAPGKDDSAEKAAALAKRVKEAQERLDEAKLGKDSVGIAKLHLAQAEAHARDAEDAAESLDAETEKIKANQEIRDAFIAIFNAEDEALIAAANRAHDYVKAADIAAQQAQLALDDAKDSGDQGAIIAAQSNLDDRIEDLRQARIKQIDNLFDAQNDLSTALAEAAGHTVEVARLAAEKAQHAYQSAVGEFGAGSPEALQAQANAVRQAAQVRDAQLSESEENIQFALDMEEITKDQALAQFQALLQLPSLTLQQTRDIRRKIKELQGDLNQDLQMDLPTDIRLPTLYQVARYNTGYADNRVITFNVAVGNGVDAGNLVNNIANTVNGPPRSGTTSPVY